MGGLTCPRCRRDLAAVHGSGDSLYGCAGAHVFSPRTLLGEQTRLASRILCDLEAALESKLALSSELASKADTDGQTHLLRYLEREIESGRETLALVQSQLRNDGDWSE